MCRVLSQDISIQIICQGVLAGNIMFRALCAVVLNDSMFQDSKIPDSNDFIVHLKHHIRNGNCSSVTQ